MKYNIWINIALLFAGLAILTYMLWSQTSITDIKQSVNSIYYNWFIGVFITLCIVSNAVQTYVCTYNLSDVGGSVLYTLLGWMSFMIIVAYRDYLRIPLSNVLGYIIYARSIDNLVTGINLNIVCKDPEQCPKDGERSIFEICTLLRSGDLFDKSMFYLWPQLNYAQGVSSSPAPGMVISDEHTSSPSRLYISNTELAEYITKLFMVCYRRDIIGELALFILSGLTCSFIYAYLTSKYVCK